MKFAHLAARFHGSLWLMREDALTAIAEVLESRINYPGLPPDSAPTETSPATQALSLAAGIAVVDIEGVLGKRLSSMETMCGGCDYDAALDEAESALSLPAVRALVLRIGSPGGTVVGCPEAHARLLSIRATYGKPIVAFTETECCSAAYWLASATDKIYATPSALVGSTGAKLVLRDQSEKNAKEGVKFTVFKSGSMKDIGSPHRAPTEEETALLQARIDRQGAEFRASVLRGRPGVAEECFTTAMLYDGTEAIRLGLVDTLVTSLAAVVSDLS